MQNEKKYFASANTEKGFVSYFDEIYGCLERVYIIKGGPGTGKSHFMRNIADEAEGNGYSVEYFYCSSDPLSLDGIIIEELGVAVIDGTSPHTYDPKVPGIREVIINLGNHWDSKKLEKNKDEICRLVNEKSMLYNNVYNYLSAAGRVESEIRIFNRRAVKFEKMQAAVNRLSKGWKQGDGYKKKIRLVEGISHAGHIVYNTYHDLAENKYVIKDRYGVGTLFIDMIIKCAENKRLKIVYSPSYIDASSVMGVYLPEISHSFVICEDNSIDKKQINMDRFVDAEIIKSNKQKNRFARRCLNSLYEGVQKGFDDIFDIHSKIEGYYINAMDFSKNIALAGKIKEEIFKI
ncbi:MAG: hypothetical protein E7593_04650 [Ruminococcaceae bacterium]|nr:hypothetical protein [Oscillospiraceae bacterium]